MIRRPPRSTRTDTLFPYTTLFRAVSRFEIQHPQTCVTIKELPLGDPFSDVLAGRIDAAVALLPVDEPELTTRSEEHTSELQSLMRISYAVFCLKKKKNTPKPSHKH